MFEVFFLQPILRGLFATIFSGIAFPLCGVMVLRLNLVPLRYMLMHGVILGGAIALALSLPLVPVCILINLVLVFLMLNFTRTNNFGFNGASAATMVLSMALASAIMHVKDVPAKDTLSLMWGSPFALSKSDLVILILLCVFLLFYVMLNLKNILSLFFNKDVARATGIKVELNYFIMTCVIALTIALAMKILGAFLIDSLLIMPVICASSILKNRQSSIKKLFVLSSVLGFIFATSGYIISVILNFPPAATISIISGIGYLISIIGRKK